MYRAAELALIVLLSVMSAGQGTPAPRDSGNESFTRTAAAILHRDFSGISYLLLDIRSGVTLASNWDGAKSPVPVGSLLKPFTAIAYAEAHHFRFPQHTCTAGACWLPRGHGRLGIVRATALSCNAYYTQLAAQVSPAQVAEVARRFGLKGPRIGASPEELIGMHSTWGEAPQAIARAYAELLGRRTQPGVKDIVEGMAEAARDGTAAGIGHPVARPAALAKTGTAPCTHKKHAPGDGFVVVAWPADAPRYLLLARQHGVPGARAAFTAGRMLRALEPQ